MRPTLQVEAAALRLELAGDDLWDPASQHSASPAFPQARAVREDGKGGLALSRQDLKIAGGQ
jgi:hypothetical protein